MIKVRTNLIKLCALVFSVCLAFAVFTLPNNKVSAEETKTFEVVQEAKIREAEGDVAGGLRFTTNISGDYSGVKFGTLIFPAKNWDGSALSGAVDTNASNLKAVNVVAGNYDGSSTSFDASLIFDENTILTYVQELGGDETDLDTVMFNLHTMEFTAVAYAEVDGGVEYSTPYTTSMRLTATKKYLAGNDDETVLGYLGGAVDAKTVGTNTVTAGAVVDVDDVVDYANTGSTKMYVNEVATDVNVGVDENINLAPAGVESVYLFEQDKTTILNVVTKEVFTKSGIDYSALENHIIDGDINDSNVIKVSFGGVEYDRTSKDPTTSEDLLYFETVNGEEKFVGFRGKKTASASATNGTITNDSTIGIDYYAKNNATANNKEKAVTCENFFVEADDAIYQITSIKYWTRVINDADELKLTLDHDYDGIKGTDNIEIETSRSEYGIFFRINGSGSSMYQRPFNHGYYKLGNDINMQNEDGTYVTWNFPGYDGTDSLANYDGGFAGYFDGYGHTIENFRPGSEYGMFCKFMTYGSGSNSSNYLRGAIVKNFRILNPDLTYNRPLLGFGINTDGSTIKETRGCTIQDICVEYGNITGGVRGLVEHPADLTVMKNIYVKYDGNDDGSYFGMVKGSELGSKGYFNFDGVEINDDEYYFLDLAQKSTYDHFGSVFIGTTRWFETQSNYSNVIVNSRSPIAHYTRSDYPGLQIVYASSGKDYVTIKENRHLGGKLTKNTNAYYNFYHAFGYASNEDEGYILAPKAVEPTALSDLTEITLSNYASQTGGYCDTCHKVTLKEVTAGEACTRTADCSGTMVVENGWQGFWSSPIAYVWTTHKSSEMTSAFSDDNGAVKLDGVLKYKTADAMKEAYNQNNDLYAGFTSSYWSVVEGELVWVGAQA